MFRDLFENVSLTALPIAAMLLFLGIFVAVIVRVSRKARAATYEQMAQLPLQDDPCRRTDR